MRGMKRKRQGSSPGRVSRGPLQSLPIWPAAGAEVRGLHVLGLQRPESRRIDHQLRGHAGRQGDPGSSQFSVSLQDDLLVKYGVDQLDSPDAPASTQRLIEDQNLQIRQFLRKYEGVVEGQRQAVQQRRQ